MMNNHGMREIHLPVRMAPLIANQLITLKTIVIAINNDPSRKYSLICDFSLFAWFQFESTSEYLRPIEMIDCCLHLQQLHIHNVKTAFLIFINNICVLTSLPDPISTIAVSGLERMNKTCESIHLSLF